MDPQPTGSASKRPKIDRPEVWSDEEYRRLLKSVKRASNLQLYLNFGKYKQGLEDPTEGECKGSAIKSGRGKRFVRALSALKVIPVVITNPYRQKHKMSKPGMFFKAYWTSSTYHSDCILTPDGWSSPFKLGREFYRSSNQYKSAIKIAVIENGKERFMNLENLFDNPEDYQTMPEPKPVKLTRKTKFQMMSVDSPSDTDDVSSLPDNESLLEGSLNQDLSKEDEEDEESDAPNETENGELESEARTPTSVPLTREIYKDVDKFREYVLAVHRPIFFLSDGKEHLNFALKHDLAAISTVTQPRVDYFYDGVPCGLCTPYFSNLKEFFSHQKMEHGIRGTDVNLQGNYSYCPQCVLSTKGTVVFFKVLDYFIHFQNEHFSESSAVKVDTDFFWKGVHFDVLASLVRKDSFAAQHKDWSDLVDVIVPIFQ